MSYILKQMLGIFVFGLVIFACGYYAQRKERKRKRDRVKPVSIGVGKQRRAVAGEEKETAINYVQSADTGMIYRWIVILAHKFDWHHAPVHGPFEDGRYQRWCQWCGLRQGYDYDPRKPILGPLQGMKGNSQ